MRFPTFLHRSTTILTRGLSRNSNNTVYSTRPIPDFQWIRARTNTPTALSGVTHSQRLREMSTSGNVTPSRIQPARKFTAIPGSDVYVSHPAMTAAEQATSQKPPSIILIFGWMDAQLSHLHKYTEKYHAIYPSATQVLVRTHQKYFWKGEPARRASVFPVVKLLRDAGISDATPPQSSGLLVHTFSNGGALAQTCLARAISASTSSHPALPAQAFVYDSLPGTISLRNTITAFTAPIRSAPLRALAKIVFGSFYILAKIYRHTIAPLLGQKEDPFARLHRELNEERLLPQHVPRTYIYSDVDELIPMESVEGHAKKAREGVVNSGGDGSLVKTEKFEGSPHVAHARKEPERYWETVVKTWARSC